MLFTLEDATEAAIPFVYKWLCVPANLFRLQGCFDEVIAWTTGGAAPGVLRPVNAPETLAGREETERGSNEWPDTQHGHR
jgi:hypothetical protein